MKSRGSWTWPTLRSSATTRTTRSPPASLGSSKPTPSTVQAGVADLPSLPNMANMAFQRIEILTYTICSNFEGSAWVNDLYLPFLWWFEEWMMAQVKVHGIFDKVKGQCFLSLKSQSKFFLPNMAERGIVRVNISSIWTSDHCSDSHLPELRA